MFVTITAVAVITGPTFALYFERRLIIRLALVVVFSLTFAITLAVLTVSKNQEIFAIVAALVCPWDLDVISSFGIFGESLNLGILLS